MRSTPEKRMLRIAQTSALKADESQTALRKARVDRAVAVQTGNTTGQHVATKEMFSQLAQVVKYRNRELQGLGGFVATADVSTPKNGTYFWSGDMRDNSGKVVNSAMTTAQSMARLSGGRTVEMTPGGKQLDEYAGHPNSFGFLKERFKYVKQPGALISSGAKLVGVPIGKEMTQGRSAAGGLWDVSSMRFAKQGVGDVHVIHAAPKTDPYFASKEFDKSTWMSKEQPTLIAQRKTVIKERFAEDLKGRLKGAVSTKSPDWSGTGGYPGNLPQEHQEERRQFALGRLDSVTGKIGSKHWPAIK